MITRTLSLAAILAFSVGCNPNQPQQVPVGIPGQTVVPGMTGIPGLTGVPGLTAAPVTAVPVTAGPGTTAITPTAPGGDFLQNEMNRIYAQFGQGRQPVSPLFRGNLGTSQTQDFSVNLQNGHCYTLIGVGVASVTDLDLFLFDQNGTQVAQDQATDNFPVVSSCPTTTGAFRVQAKMYAGSGEFGLQVFGS